MKIAGDIEVILNTGWVRYDEHLWESFSHRKTLFSIGGGPKHISEYAAEFKILNKIKR